MYQILHGKGARHTAISKVAIMFILIELAS